MNDNNTILKERFLEQLVLWMRRQKYDEPDFRRMARSGSVGDHPQKHAAFTFSSSHNAYMALLVDKETGLDVLESWVTALTKLRGRRKEILARCLPFLPAGETGQEKCRGSNVIWVQTAWAWRGQYERLKFPAVRDCLFTFARHALRYSFEILKQQETALAGSHS